MKVSEIFHMAADKYLSVEARSTDDDILGQSWFTCYCLCWVVYNETGLSGCDAADLFDDIYVGLESLGLNSGPGSFNAFTELDRDIRQGARYAWLKFCSMLAEESEALIGNENFEPRRWLTCVEL